VQQEDIRRGELTTSRWWVAGRKPGQGGKPPDVMLNIVAMSLIVSHTHSAPTGDTWVIP
jgi:hypothetical protein